MSAPMVPPRPSRSPAKEAPKVPPRPIRKSREVSPDPRFAKSPLKDVLLKPSTKLDAVQLDPQTSTSLAPPNVDPSRPAMSARMPSEVGDEGQEYEVAEEIEQVHQKEEEAVAQKLEEEQLELAKPILVKTSLIGGDVEMHAPRPSLPQSLSAVKNTTSESALEFGIDASGVASKAESIITDDSTTSDAIRHVPMIPDAGYVQAPDNFNLSRPATREAISNGFVPGSYGLHSHGAHRKDKLDNEYYDKHPEILQEEQKRAVYQPRQVDFARSSEYLNNLVNTGDEEGVDTTTCGPSEDLAHEVQEEFARHSPEQSRAQSRAQSPGNGRNPRISVVGNDEIHIDQQSSPLADNGCFEVPILASDEVAKRSGSAMTPAVEVQPRETKSDNSSKSNSRPMSVASPPPTLEFPQEKEYEPLAFVEKGSKTEDTTEKNNRHTHKFPSKDIWEEAPPSVFEATRIEETDSVKDVEEKVEEIQVSDADTTEYQEIPDKHFRPSTTVDPDAPVNPALAFALKQEKLAEEENRSRSRGHGQDFIPRGLGMKSTPAVTPPAVETFRPQASSRFPSRDVWEDAPDSSMSEAVIGPDVAEKPKVEDTRPPLVGRDSAKLPPKELAIRDSSPEKSTPSRPTSVKPLVPERPKPKAKPPIPARPVGGKIAALQAGFMSDLNRRLQLGPQAPKKEEPAPPIQPKPASDDEPAPAPVKEKSSLSDARKGRARGPQRRTPAKVVAAKEEAKEEIHVPSFGISRVQLFWALDNVGVMGFDGTLDVKKDKVVEVKTKEAEEKVGEVKEEPKLTDVPVVEPTTISEDKSLVPEIADVASKEAPVTADKEVAEEAPVKEDVAPEVATEEVPEVAKVETVHEPEVAEATETAEVTQEVDSTPVVTSTAEPVPEETEVKSEVSPELNTVVQPVPHVDSEALSEAASSAKLIEVTDDLLPTSSDLAKDEPVGSKTVNDSVVDANAAEKVGA